jgi:hypothetical protein
VLMVRFLWDVTHFRMLRYGRGSYIHSVKQFYWAALNVCVTRCALAGNVVLKLRDVKRLPGYSTTVLEFSLFSSGNW